MNIMNRRFEIFEFVEIAFSERIMKRKKVEEKKGNVKVTEKNSGE